MRIFNLLIICFFCTTLVSAQTKERATEMISAIKKYKVDKESYLSDVEKQIIDVASKDKHINLKTVNIDRKTGMISATVIDGKGQEKAMNGTQLLTQLNQGASSTNNSYPTSLTTTVTYDCSGCFLPETLCYYLGLCREIIIVTPGAPTTLTPEQKRKVDENRMRNGEDPIYSGQY